MPTEMVYRNRLEEARRATGNTEWPNNALRHSFASYHLAAFQDASALALEMGHSTTRIGRQSADFDVAKSLEAEGIDGVCFLIQSGREADGIWDSQSRKGNGLRFRGGGDGLEQAELLAGAESSHGEMCRM